MADKGRFYSNELVVIRKEREPNAIDSEFTSGFLIEVSRSCCCASGMGWNVQPL